jgi:hypothetical protein
LMRLSTKLLVASSFHPPLAYPSLSSNPDLLFASFSVVLRLSLDSLLESF